MKFWKVELQKRPIEVSRHSQSFQHLNVEIALMCYKKISKFIHFRLKTRWPIKKFIRLKRENLVKRPDEHIFKRFQKIFHLKVRKWLDEPSSYFKKYSIKDGIGLIMNIGTLPKMIFQILKNTQWMKWNTFKKRSWWDIK